MGLKIKKPVPNLGTQITEASILRYFKGVSFLRCAEQSRALRLLKLYTKLIKHV